MSMMRTPKLLTGLALLMSAGAIGVGAGSLARRPGPVAPVVAIVNIKKVMDGLKEREEKYKTLRKRVSDLETQNKQTIDQRTGDQTKITAMAAGPAKDQALREFRDKYFRANIERKFTEESISEDEVTMLRELYLKIDDAAETLAKKNGYQLVLSSDEKMEIPAPPEATREQLSQVINLKRMLYVDPQLDITDEVLTHMNNLFAAGGGAAPGKP
jgi:Skp family chaperone for outer membrane proteins